MLAALTMLLCTGCSEDDTESTGDYCSISSLSIGSLRRTVVKRTGHGTTYKSVSTIYTTGWAFTIDQVNNEIYNRDSLPTRCSRTTVLNIAYRGRSIVYRLHNAPAATAWTAWNSTDSLYIPEDGGIDLKVYGSDGSERTYNMKLNIHKMEMGDWQWKDMTEELDMSTWSEARIAAIGNDVLLYGKGASGWNAVHGNEENAWETLTLTGITCDRMTSDMVNGSGCLFMTDADGNVWKSEDGAEWSETGLTGVSRLVAASPNRLYAIKDGTLCSTALSGNTEWTEEHIDDKPESVTTLDDLGSSTGLFYERQNGLKKLLLIATLKNPTKEDITAMAWGKMWNASGNEKQREWIYYTPSWATKFGLPAMSPLAVVNINESIMAFGGIVAQNEDLGIQPLNLIYFSQDDGLSWRTDDLHYLPDELWGKDCSWLSATTDSEDCVWIVARVNDTEVYVVRGKQNSAD